MIMRTSQVLLWFGLAELHQSVDGLPATFCIEASRDIYNPGSEAAGYHQHPRAEVKLGRGLGRRAPPKKGGVTPPKAPVVVPVPQTPVGKGNAKSNTPGAPDKDKDGKGKGSPPPSPAPGKGTDPVTPAPSKKGKFRVYKLGKCGSEDARDEIKNIDSEGNSPPKKRKTSKPPKTPKAPKLKNRPDNDGDDDYVKPHVSVTNLLSVFPGGEFHKGEMLLLPGRLNNKKAPLFSVREHNVMSPVDFPNYSLHRKIHELREIVLLIEYLNSSDVAKYFKTLSLRIQDRLAKIDADGNDAFVRDIDDWWFKQKNNRALKDAPGEQYKSLKLGGRKDVCGAAERNREDLQGQLRDSNEGAEKKNIKKAVKVQAYVIGSVSSPNTSNVSDSEPFPEDDGNSDSDALPESPTRPRPAPGQGQPMNLPRRPAPPSVARPSTPLRKSRRL
ncbi:hypothetical protein ST47_g882 [Ascochyta rabiei]|uniref:Uncharacterized protein n=1 Tax=Didymella rabiei TaxID=5454 RepID=A0A163LP03_DIDRA|nr:hypothetical protein ST47_g882 [Ascochyta rabiei]